MEKEEAIELLKKYATDPKSLKKVLAHGRAVCKVALRIAARIPSANKKFIEIASLLHDIGRLSFPPESYDNIRHGVEGAEILRKEGHEDLARVAERHLGAGITKQDIIEHGLNLPHKDFVPETTEEKIIAHADNLIAGTKEISFTQTYNRFKKEINEAAAEKAKKLKKEIESMMTSSNEKP